MSNEERMIFCSNLPGKVTELLLYELFLQAGPIDRVHIPSLDGKNRTYGFVTFKHKCSVPYASQLMKNTYLYGRKLMVRPSQRSGRHQQNVPQQSKQMGVVRGHKLSGQLKNESGKFAFNYNREPNRRRGLLFLPFGST
ncbi:hypothetical protein AAG570_000818 [Ranatra chinensis]|uniref:RRM domain-containing protein n=1 Tax=Ranatra chinensis TaxID=642074 RepID=A0ABD0YYH8_9HEMI